MKVCTCFMLFGIFAYTNSIPRTQETVGEYSNEEYSGDTNNLDNAHTFISRGTTVQDKNRQFGFRARVETLTDFIQEVVHILNTYEDTAFEDFFHVLDNEIRQYHYKGCKFSELTQNSDTRRFLAASLKLIRGKPVSFTKANINKLADMLRDETYNKNVKDLLDYINSLYTNTELNFYSLLNELKYYRNTKTVRTHINLVQIIRGGIRAILFNPYTELNTRTRRELKKRIETFWKQFKNNPASSAEMNDIPYTNPVIKSVSNSFKVSENIMNEVNNPEPYSKNDPQVKSKNKIERVVSIKTNNEQFQDEETEEDESNASGKQIINYNTDEISSGQSFDSSSNSIRNSQERHFEYNTQRYMTLYTEEISHKSKTTKKTEIIPISANVMTKSSKVKKRLTTTSTPMESDVSSDRTERIEMLRANHDSDDTKLDISYSSIDSGLTLESKHEPRTRENYDKSRKQGKADELRSKSKLKNVEIISEHDAVIDVQLANTELLKSLRMFEPLRMDTNSRYDTTLYRKSAIQTETVPIKSTIRPGSMRTEVDNKAPIPTALTKSPSISSKRNKPFYRKQLSDFRVNIAPPLPNEGKNQSQKYLRSFVNDTIGAENFNTYVIRKLNAMENELKELKQMNNFSFRSRINDNNTDAVEPRNVTDKIESIDKVDSKRKYMKGNVFEKSLNQDNYLNNEEVNNKHEFIINTESSTTTTKSRKLNVTKKDAINATLIDNKNTTQVTNIISKINVNVTKKLSKGVINNNVITSTISLVKVTNTTKLESVVTTPTIGITRRTMAYSEPLYYGSLQENRPTVRNSQFDPFFDHVNDGMDLHM